MLLQAVVSMVDRETMLAFLLAHDHEVTEQDLLVCMARDWHTLVRMVITTYGEKCELFNGAACFDTPAARRFFEPRGMSVHGLWTEEAPGSQWQAFLATLLEYVADDPQTTVNLMTSTKALVAMTTHQQVVVLCVYNPPRQSFFFFARVFSRS